MSSSELMKLKLMRSLGMPLGMLVITSFSVPVNSGIELAKRGKVTFYMLC